MLLSNNKQSFSNAAVNPFKTFQGLNDDSQIAYYYQNMLFQNPLPNSAPTYSCRISYPLVVKISPFSIV